MKLTFRPAFATALAAIALLPSPAAAQAFTPPQGVGSLTLAWQFVDNTGHRLTDGFINPLGQSQTTSALVELDYGVTDRLSATVGLPYVFAKYTGANAPQSGQAVDICRCWQSAFQDFSFGARYRFGDDRWAVTPTATFGVPSHDYPFAGEAVVGRNLREAQVGLASAVKLVDLLPKASVQASYTYSVVQRAVTDVGVNRSNSHLEFGYAVTRGVYLRGDASWQRTHGGLRVGSVTGVPFPLPGEFSSTPERFAQRDRLGRVNYWHAGAGASFPAGPADIFVSFTKYVAGTDTHNGQAYTVGSTFYFDLKK